MSMGKIWFLDHEYMFHISLNSFTWKCIEKNTQKKDVYIVHSVLVWYYFMKRISKQLTALFFWYGSQMSWDKQSEVWIFASTVNWFNSQFFIFQFDSETMFRTSSVLYSEQQFDLAMFQYVFIWILMTYWKERFACISWFASCSAKNLNLKINNLKIIIIKNFKTYLKLKFIKSISTKTNKNGKNTSD